MARPSTFHLLLLLAACALAAHPTSASGAREAEKGSGDAFLAREGRSLRQGNAVLGRQGTIKSIACNRTGTNVFCSFCNYDTVPIQNVALGYFSQVTQQNVPFDGTNLRGVRRDGNLNVYMKAGTCVTFSYKSNKNLVALYNDASSCSGDSNPLAPGSVAISGTDGPYYGYCWATKQTSFFGKTFDQTVLTCDVSCRLVNKGPSVDKPTFSVPVVYDTEYSNLFGNLKCDLKAGTCKLDYKLRFGESGLFGFTYVYANPVTANPAAPVVRSSGVKGTSGPSFEVPCDVSGNKYSCKFCNGDIIALQNVGLTLGDGQKFDGKNRKNINSAGYLTGMLYPGECVTFSFTSSSALNFFYNDLSACSAREEHGGYLALGATSPADATFAIDRCYPATQIYDPTQEVPIGCQIKCRPYNYYRDVAKPVFPCDQNGVAGDVASISDVVGNAVAIYATSWKLSVLGDAGPTTNPTICKLNSKLGYGESDQFDYTYYYTEAPPQ